MTTYTITAHSSSATCNAGVPVTPVTTAVLGNVAPNVHFLLRFDASAIPAAAIIVRARLAVRVAAKGAGTPPSINLYASEFQSAISSADYALADTNSTSSVYGYRVKLGQIIPSTVTVGVSGFGQMAIPSRFIKKAGETYTYSDFELRPVTETSGATDTISISGPNTNTAIVLSADETQIVGTGYAPTLTIVTITSAEELSQNDYRSYVTGDESYIAFDRETTRGTPVKGKYLVDEVGNDLEIEADNLVSQALRRERSSPNKIVVGPAGGGGSVSFELTPEKIWTLLTGFLKLSSATSATSTTVTTALATAAQVLGSTTGMVAGGTLYFVSSKQSGTILSVDSGTAVTLTEALTTASIVGETVYYGSALLPFTTILKRATSSEVASFTFVKGQGVDWREVYAGGMLNTFSVSASFGAIVTGSVSIAARRVFVYDAESSGLTTDPYILSSSAGYDSNQCLSFAGCEIAFDTVANYGTISNINISLSNSIGVVAGLRRRRDITGHYAGALIAEVSFDMEFESDYQLRTFLAVSHSDKPYTAELAQVITQRLDLKLAGPLGADYQEVIITFFKMAFVAVRKPTSGKGTVKLSCTGMAVYDSTNSTNVQVSIKNSEAPTQFVNASTDYITVLPENVTFP